MRNMFVGGADEDGQAKNRPVSFLNNVALCNIVAEKLRAACLAPGR
jgi:hypothetical protein